MILNANATSVIAKKYERLINSGNRKLFLVFFTYFLCLALQSCAASRLNFSQDIGTSSYGERDVSKINAAMQAADVAYDQGDWDQAIFYYKKILSAIPTDPYAWFRLGNVYTRIGKINQAIHAYETSLTYNSAQFKPWFNLSTAHLLGAKIATLESLKSINASDPTRAMVSSRLETLNLLLR